MADLRAILEAIDKAALVTKSIAETPGINALPYVGTLSSVIGAVHAAYTAGKNIEPYITAIAETYSKPDLPTEADMAALDAKIKELEVDEPLPPKDADEPE